MISNRVNPTINTSKGFDIPIYNYQTYVEHQQNPKECNAQSQHGIPRTNVPGLYIAFFQDYLLLCP